MAYPKIRRNRILHTHSFHRVISTENTLILYPSLDEVNHHVDKRYNVADKAYKTFYDKYNNDGNVDIIVFVSIKELSKIDIQAHFYKNNDDR